MSTQVIDGPLTSEGVAAVARGARLELSAQARDRIVHARALVDVIVKRRIRAYGVNTGVGALCDTLVDEAQQKRLSHNIVMSHACGVGEPVSVQGTRAIMACAVNNFALGGSGVRPAVVDTLLALLNADLIPVVPREGSIGYITMMAHVALVLMGNAEVHSGAATLPGAEALRRLGTSPLVLEAKEGLSLVNGTPDTTGLACLGLERLAALLDWGDIIAAMTFENLGHNLRVFAAESLNFSGFDSIRTTGRKLSRLLADSSILSRSTLRTQDAMSLRAVPQVHGAVRDCFDAGRRVVNRELASITDNPIVSGTLQSPVVYSGAHAIATGLALSLDSLAIAVAKIAAMSERRIDRLVNPLVSGLPAFLTRDAGATSGFMIAQYTALALASENRRLAAPSSLDGGVSSGAQEDEIPHATAGALRLLRIIDNYETILAIELLSCAQAYEFQNRALARAAATDSVYRALRKTVTPYADDRPFAMDIKLAVDFLRREQAPL